jgi:hypothetical protein
MSPGFSVGTQHVDDKGEERSATHGAVEFYRRTHFTTVEAARPKRFAAARQLIPLAMALTVLARRSLDRGFVMRAGLLRQPAS